jgi:RNA polymerase sigma factor (sigma-70 family)
MLDREERDEFVTRLFEQYQEMVEKSCMRMVRYNPEYQDLVDHCVQEVFIAALIAYSKLRDHPSVPAWLLKTAHNCMKNALRKRKHQMLAYAKWYDTDLHEAIDSISKWHAAAHNSETIKKIHDSLTQKESVVFQQYFLEKRGIPVIAADYAVPKNAITSIVYRIRKKAKKTFFENF